MEFNSKESVLIVDDEADIREILSIYVSEFGFCVDVAEDGVSALSKIKEKKYNFVFTDLKMPSMDGFELVSEIINLNYPETKIIVISASSFCDYPSQKESLLKKIIHGYIEKPFSKDDIFKVMQKIKNASTLLDKSADIEEVIKNYIEQRKIITIIDSNGFELSNVVPVSYEDGYLECGRPDSKTLLVFNSINEIVLIDELSSAKRLFARHDLRKEVIGLESDLSACTECRVLDYSYTGLGIKVDNSFKYENIKGAIILRKRRFPCEFIYHNRELHRVGVNISLKVGKEINKLLSASSE